jgi:hypothetical protein
MGRLCIPRYTVIRDTREKEGYGWYFNEQSLDRRPPSCNGTIEQKLDTGDYSLVGYEDILTIERKNDFSELWVNLSERDRFEEEMARMVNIKYSYILIESVLTSDHFNLSPPQYKRGVPGKALIKWIFYIGIKYNVNVIPVGGCGKSVARVIFEEVVRKEKDRWILSG